LPLADLTLPGAWRTLPRLKPVGPSVAKLQLGGFAAEYLPEWFSR
jgi:hypothetical protein